MFRKASIPIFDCGANGPEIGSPSIIGNLIVVMAQVLGGRSKRIVRPQTIAVQANHYRALEFIYDSLYCGKRFRILNVLEGGLVSV